MTIGRIVLVTNYYPEFLKRLYRDEPGISDLPYSSHLRALLETDFAAGDAYSANLSRIGWDAIDIICNADLLQARWARENGLRVSGNIHDQRRQVVDAQIRAFDPDVVYVFEWSPLGDAFLAEIRAQGRLVVGQIASSMRADRTYAAYDLMLSAWPPIVEHICKSGRDAEHFRLAFDQRILDRLPAPDGEMHDVTFVGGFAPAHGSRVPWLESVLEHVPVRIFGYGREHVPPSSPIHDHHHGEAWGRRLYDVLRRSRVTLHHNAMIEVGGVPTNRHAAAMRFYESTGVGTCLLTDELLNLCDILEPGREVAIRQAGESTADAIGRLLADEGLRSEIARAGQARTLRDHTYEVRMQQLSDLLCERLDARATRSTGGGRRTATHI